MTEVDEVLGAKTQLGGDLAAGLKTLSLNQTVCFNKYIRQVLPVDGFVFWVNASILSGAALAAAGTFAVNAPMQIEAQGSLHYATDRRQQEDETIAVNRVLFTSLQPVQAFQDIAPNVIFIAEFQGIRFAFSRQANFYRQADLYHYEGDAIYPDMETQIVDDVGSFNSSSQIVSNSLPFWLSLNNYQPFYGFGNTTITLYPSYLVPQNISPASPFAAVHIEPESTQSVAAAPYLDQATSTHSQLVRETARITLWGANNTQALNFIDCVNQYSLDTENIGIMNMPAVRDEKRTQVELSAIAMKKSIIYEINYLQYTMRQIAMQAIKQAIPSFIIQNAA